MILQNARNAARALRVHKLRSALAMLGIVIGVGAVIAMVAVGAGAEARVLERIQSLGSNIIVVTANSSRVAGVRAGQGSRATLTDDDAAAIQHPRLGTYPQAMRCGRRTCHTGATLGGAGLPR